MNGRVDVTDNIASSGYNKWTSGGYYCGTNVLNIAFYQIVATWAPNTQLSLTGGSADNVIDDIYYLNG